MPAFVEEAVAGHVRDFPSFCHEFALPCPLRSCTLPHRRLGKIYPAFGLSVTTRPLISYPGITVCFVKVAVNSCLDPTSTDFKCELDEDGAL